MKITIFKLICSKKLEKLGLAARRRGLAADLE